jgi:5-(carboxyamino)imidazole ribonucleotide mutase
MSKKEVAIVMGSASDKESMQQAADMLEKFGVPFAWHIMSAHRTPDRVHEFITSAAKEGTQVFIAAAGKAAHLAGVVASLTIHPVIGVPMTTSDLGGLDSLLSTVQMPPGIPVATTAIGKAGAKNAALLAVSILALNNAGYQEKLVQYRKDQTEAVNKADQELQKELG